MFDLELEPRGRATVFLEAACAPDGDAAPPARRVPGRLCQTKRGLRASAARAAAISSRNEEFEETVRRSANDLRMLVTDKPTGPYPYAGIPWFSTAFGRDALITALLMLALDPALARGVLRYLAQEQATEFDPASEAEPGKILHEMRGGEMAALREVPFRRYYGSVNSTPLFVMLAGAYLDRTGDLATVQALWPHIELALGWMDRRADADGFVSYQRSTEDGLANQGWKDSYDSISHADGTLARGAIALCEVQGYVYAARRAGAAIARRLGLDEQAAALETKAEHLRQAFEARFWCERLGTYALGAGRRRAAMRGARLQRRAPAHDGDRRAGAGAPRRQRLMEPRLLHRLGHPHAGRRRGALQPDVLPQRLGLAARQRADRARHGAHGPAGGDARLFEGIQAASAPWICAGCRSCSAASIAAPARDRPPTRWRARRRPGPPRPFRLSCRPALASVSTRRRAPIGSTAPACPPFVDPHSPQSRSTERESAC